MSDDELETINEWFQTTAEQATEGADFQEALSFDGVQLDTDSESDDEQPAGNLDTCFFPDDLPQQMRDSGGQIWSVAPAEGERPVHMLDNVGIESTIFPCFFLFGVNTFNSERSQPLSASTYFQSRLMSADSRFARSSTYIFFGCYLSELEHIRKAITVAVRQGHEDNESRYTYDMLVTEEGRRRFMTCHGGFQFLRPLRGSPPY